MLPPDEEKPSPTTKFLLAMLVHLADSSSGHLIGLDLQERADKWDQQILEVQILSRTGVNYFFSSLNFRSGTEMKKWGLRYSPLLEMLAYFVFSDKGLDAQAVDSSGLALVALLLPSEAFDYYRCDRAVSGGLSLVDMAKAFRRANDDDILTIKAMGDRFNMVTFTFETPNGVIRDYDFNCVDIDEGPLEIKETPESEYQATVCISSAMFMGICNNLSSLTERGTAPAGVMISVDKERVEFFTHGGTGILKGSVSRQTQTVGKPKEPVLIRSKEEVSLTFELRPMNSFSKASTLSDHVTIHLSSKQPAVFEYKILGMGYIRYYMMPGISKEDEVQKMQRMAIED